MARSAEGKVQDKIIKYLTQLHKDGYKIIHDKRQAGGLTYKEGMADIWVVFLGIHIEIEVKEPGEELRAAQEKWLSKMNQMGIHNLVAESVDDVKRYFKENGFL